MIFDFQSQQEAWSRPPVDDYGYLSSEQLLAMPDQELRHLITRTEKTRYSGWRNYENRWRECLGLDTTEGKRILDFGCGIGLEALQFAPRNEVIVADIVPANTHLAQRINRLFGYNVTPVTITETKPFIESDPVDIFYCNGVLHHIPYADQILQRAAEIATEIRLMLYSDRGWLKYVGSPLPPIDQDVRENPDFERFVRVFDEVGSYADWYSEEKIQRRFGAFLDLQSFDYITDDDRYCAVTLHPKPLTIK